MTGITTTIDNETPDQFDDAWISVDALILIGIINCGGFDSEKA